MLHDIHESLEDIHVSPVSMKEQIREIQPYIIPRTSAQQWAQNLRFIACGDKPASEPIQLDNLVVGRDVSYDEDYDDDDDVNSDERFSDDANIRPCDCVKKNPYPSDPKPNGRRQALHLTAPGDVKRCNDYVAVSYCWPKSDGLPDKPLDKCFTVHKKTGTGSRTNLAPTNLLERAMSFAGRHNYKLIWIDQECIEQRHDSKDREFGIQSMDQVFQNAPASDALLSGCIDEQRQLDAIFWLS
ncbi:hypothetical protein NW767_001552 [Fusarium falciforme]|nr:hypothetical protein NW767_001552 [Fusarium falciforme]